MKFVNPIDSNPSSKILDSLYEHDDFMESIRTLVDLGCGQGNDLEWWATRTTRDESQRPLNIRCVGVDLLDQLPMARRHTNVTYQRTDFETQVYAPAEKFDVLWCHDAFQYCKNPLQTLRNWREIASPGAMLIIAVPETVSLFRGHVSSVLPSGVLYHHTVVSLIYMLAITGWDCRNGFFYHQPGDPWIRAVVYKNDQEQKNITTPSWYDLLDLELLPESADKSVKAHGFLRQQDLVLPWLDHNLYCLGKP